MVDRRATLTREVISSIVGADGSNIRIFGEQIPRSVRAAETSAQGVSIFKRDVEGSDRLRKSILTSIVSRERCRA
jgi:chromosome partitioning protein